MTDNYYKNLVMNSSYCSKYTVEHHGVTSELRQLQNKDYYQEYTYQKLYFYNVVVSETRPHNQDQFITVWWVVLIMRFH